MYKILTLASLFFFICSNFLRAEVVNKIDIDGNKRVSDETIIIYGDIELNKDVSEKNVNDIIKKLYSTNFFEEVKISLKNNVLNISVKEHLL